MRVYIKKSVYISEENGTLMLLKIINSVKEEFHVLFAAALKLRLKQYNVFYCGKSLHNVQVS